MTKILSRLKRFVFAEIVLVLIGFGSGIWNWFQHGFSKAWLPMLVAVILGVSAWQHHGLRIELEKQIKLEDSSAISKERKENDRKQKCLCSIWC